MLLNNSGPNKRPAKGASMEPTNTADNAASNDTFDNDEAPTQPRSTPKLRGFAAMTDKTRLSEIARKGGKAAHARGTAHEFTAEEAKRNGRLGGAATQAKRRAMQAAKRNEVA
jgi:uncharacterized protein